MEDLEYMKQVGIELPKEITLTKEDWKDFYTALAKFKVRVMKRHGLDPRDTFSSTGRVIPHRKTERGG